MSIVVIAADVLLIGQRIRQKGLYGFICIPADTAEQPDPGLCKCRLGTAADAVADEHVNLQRGQETSQSTVALPVGADHPAAGNLPVLNAVELEEFCLSEMLKNVPVVIGDCNIHSILHRREAADSTQSVHRLHLAAAVEAVCRLVQRYLSAVDLNSFPVNQRIRQLFPGRIDDILRSGSGDVHSPGAGALIQVL